MLGQMTNQIQQASAMTPAALQQHILLMQLTAMLQPQQQTVLPNQLQFPLTSTPTLLSPPISSVSSSTCVEQKVNEHDESSDEEGDKLVIDEHSEEAPSSKNDSGLGTDLSSTSSTSMLSTPNNMLLQLFGSQQNVPTNNSSHQQLVQQILAGMTTPGLNLITTETPNTTQSSKSGRKRASDENGKFECPICHNKYSRQVSLTINV